MKYRQLEFNFVKQIKKKNWITEHVRPTIGWVDRDEEMRWNSFHNIWNNVIGHVKIGFSLRWKF